MKPWTIVFILTYAVFLAVMVGFFINMWSSSNCRDYEVFNGVNTHYVWWDGCYVSNEKTPFKNLEWKKL